MESANCVSSWPFFVFYFLHHLTDCFVNLAHFFDVRCLAWRERNQLFNFAELVTDFFDQWFIAQFRRDFVDFRLHEMNERWLAQNLRGAFIIVLHDRRGDYLRASNPTTERYQNYQVLVGVRLHRGFYFVLCRFQFFLKRVPFVVLGKFVDATAAAKQLFADPEGFCELDDVRPNILDLLTILRLHGDKAIGNQTAEVKGDLRPIAIGHRHWATILTRPVCFAWFFERCEKFTGRRNTDRIASGSFCHLVGGNVPCLRASSNQDTARQNNRAKSG